MDYGLISFFMFILVASIHSLPGIIKIGKRKIKKTISFSLMFILGGLFDISDQMLAENVKPETVFRRCVETINSLNILPNSTLSTQIERVPATDPFHTGKRGRRELRE